jgi:hypothetical protein
MTTVIDPAGTPQIIFNRSGATIVEVATASGSPPTRTPIPALSGYTIVTVDYSFTGGLDGELELPSADVGDLVEVFNTSADGIKVAAPAGESILSGLTGVNNGEGRAFRKFSPTQWGVL